MYKVYRTEAQTVIVMYSPDDIDYYLVDSQGNVVGRALLDSEKHSILRNTKWEASFNEKHNMLYYLCK